MKALLTSAALLALALPAYGNGGLFRSRANVRVNVRADVRQVRVRNVVEKVRVQNVVERVEVVQRVKVAQVVTPLVQVSTVNFAYPVVQSYCATFAAPLVAPAYGPDPQRLDRLERTVQQLADQQQQLLQSLRAPVK